METHSERRRCLSLCCTNLLLKKNLILARVKSLVFLWLLTLTYLQDCVAKKNAPVKSSQIALSNWEKAVLWNVLRIEAVMTISCFSPGSTVE